MGQNKASFGGLPEKYTQPDTAKIVVIPVPYDGTSTWVKGANRGPSAILEASANMELYDIATDSLVYQQGIYTAPAVVVNESPEAMVEAVYQTTLGYLNRGKFTVVLGGEHSVSIGAIKAHFQYYEQLTVVQIDAHADLREEYEGSRYNHACVMARVREMGPFVQMGIRSMSHEEKARIDNERTYYAEDIIGNTAWINLMLDQLSANVYITIDLDGFDPSIMPSTGTPEPGGLAWYPTLHWLGQVIKEKNVVGFDVVELCPCEHDKSPDFLAAKLVYTLLSKKFSPSC